MQWPLVLVPWLDSAAPDANWISLRDYQGIKTLECISVGYLVHEEGGRKTIAPHIAYPDDEEQRQGNGLMVIPDQAILSMERLICLSSASSVCEAEEHSSGHPECVHPSSESSSVLPLRS
jgi:hypothetical protein